MRHALVLLFVVGCGNHPAAPTDLGVGGNGDAPDLATAPDLAIAPDLAVAPDLAGASVCSDGDAVCSAWNVRRHCVGAWVDETCPAGCFAGQCTATACADECALGATSPSGTCKLWDVGQGAFVAADPAARLADRARDYDARLRAEQLVQGGVCNVVHTDATRTAVAYYSGTGDAALWTGTTLAAEAWRYQVSGAPDAAAAIARHVATLHRLFTVAGEPAYLARLALPSSDTTPLEFANRCTNTDWHCGTMYQGQSWDWYGHVSRDAYTGVVLGWALAYLASRDESVRATIRGDIVSLARELMQDRMVPATVTIGGIPVDKTLALSNVILSPAEMTNGRVQVTLGSSNELYGAREFLPDFAVVINQLVGVSPPVPRPSSAMMLGAFFTLALAATDGVAGMEATHTELAQYYAAHVDDWLSVADQWSFSANCGNGYYANRVVEDFLWQRGPWRLLDAGNPAEVYPGVDFLAAYWAARAHGFFADDGGATCARWAP